MKKLNLQFIHKQFKNIKEAISNDNKRKKSQKKEQKHLIYFSKSKNMLMLVLNKELLNMKLLYIVFLFLKKILNLIQFNSKKFEMKSNKKSLQPRKPVHEKDILENGMNMNIPFGQFVEIEVSNVTVQLPKKIGLEFVQDVENKKQQMQNLLKLQDFINYKKSMIWKKN